MFTVPEVWEITKVITSHPLNVCTQFNGNAYNMDVSLQIKQYTVFICIFIDSYILIAMINQAALTRKTAFAL